MQNKPALPCCTIDGLMVVAAIAIIFPLNEAAFGTRCQALLHEVPALGPQRVCAIISAQSKGARQELHLLTLELCLVECLLQLWGALMPVEAKLGAPDQVAEVEATRHCVDGDECHQLRAGVIQEARVVYFPSVCMQVTQMKVS